MRGKYPARSEKIPSALMTPFESPLDTADVSFVTEARSLEAT